MTNRGRRLSEGLHKGVERQRSVSALVLGTSERDISSERDMSESFNWWTAGDEQKKEKTSFHVEAHRLILTTVFSKSRRGSPRMWKQRGGGGQLGMVKDVVVQLYEEKGWVSFFSGMSARVSQVMPAQSLTICVYSLLQWLHYHVSL